MLLLKILWILTCIHFYSSDNNSKGITPPIYILLSNKQVHLLPESKMYIKGKTNINNYSCDCNNSFIQSELHTEVINNRAYFHNTNLIIPTGKINCHNVIYNNNIRNGLGNKDYPNINIELLEVWKLNGDNLLDNFGWFELASNVKVTVKNKSLVHLVKANAMQISATKYRIIGEHKIFTDDYNICIPQILYGLIQIENNINFQFDLVLEVYQN